MTVLLALAAGFAASLVLLATTTTVMQQPALARENYRGHVLPTAAGLLLVAAVLGVDGGRTLLGLVGVGDAETAAPRVLVLGAVVMFGFLGLVDDLLGDGGDRGLRGHLGALLRGRVTTGLVKLAGGIAAALVLAGRVDGDRPGRVVIDAALIALAANMGNLLDRAPGRTIKWGLACYVPVAVVAGTAATGIALAVVAGAAAGLLVADLRERVMLGDTGANAFGAALGGAAVLALGEDVRDLVALALLALTLLSEVVSFSRIITAVPPLRLLDRWGQRPEAGRP